MTMRSGFLLAAFASVAMLTAGGCQKWRERRAARFAVPQQQLGDAVELAAQAERAMQRGRKDEAIALYRQSIEASPDLAPSWHNLGLLLMEQSNYIDAVEAFKAAADLAPQDPRPYYMIGVAYHTQGWAEQALTYFTRSLERSPNYVPALRGAVAAAKSMDLVDRASLERARRALAVDPDESWRMVEQKEALRIEGMLNQQTSRIQLGGPIGTTPAPTQPQPAPSAPAAPQQP